MVIVTIDLPNEVDNYTSLYPMEPAVKNPMDKTSTFGYTSACYKAVNKKDGKLYCLRRIHGMFSARIAQTCIYLESISSRCSIEKLWCPYVETISKI